MKKIILTFTLASTIVTIMSMCKKDSSSSETNQLTEKERIMKVKYEAEQKLFQKTKNKADSALLYAKKEGFDLDHVFLVDFSIHSGKNRFFIWDFKKDTIAYSSLCAHGMGNGNNRSTYTNIRFSNVEGSYCSSLGKYKTGKRAYSNWGIHAHYKLHGLESTNDNAFDRIVVLHSYELIPQHEIYPEHIPLGYSQGCPVVNDKIMTVIDGMLQQKNKPVLLWIYQ